MAVEEILLLTIELLPSDLRIASMFLSSVTAHLFFFSFSEVSPTNSMGLLSQDVALRAANGVQMASRANLLLQT